MGVTDESLDAAIEARRANAEATGKTAGSREARKSALSNLDDLVSQARTRTGVNVISAALEGVDRESMRQLVDSLRQKLGSGVVWSWGPPKGTAKVTLLAWHYQGPHLLSYTQERVIQNSTCQAGGGRSPVTASGPDLAEAGRKGHDWPKYRPRQRIPLDRPIVLIACSAGPSGARFSLPAAVIWSVSVRCINVSQSVSRKRNRTAFPKPRKRTGKMRWLSNSVASILFRALVFIARSGSEPRSFLTWTRVANGVFINAEPAPAPRSSRTPLSKGVPPGLRRRMTQTIVTVPFRNVRHRAKQSGENHGNDSRSFRSLPRGSGNLVRARRDCKQESNWNSNAISQRSGITQS